MTPNGLNRAHIALALIALSLQTMAWGERARDRGRGKTEPTREELDRQRREIRRYHAALRDTDIVKVKEAVDGIVKVGSPLGAGYLWQLYGVGGGPRRKLALEGLAMLDVPAEHDRIFQKSLRDPLLALRRQAADMLAVKMGRDVVSGKYQDVIKNSVRNAGLYRYRAVQLLAHVGGPASGAGLLSCLEDKDPNVAVAAAEGLATIGDLKNVAGMVKHLRTENDELAPALADALDQLTGKRNRYNLVKWEQWEEDFKEGRLEEKEKKPADATMEAKEDSYDPDYRDPYAQPETQSALDFVIVHDSTGSLRRIWLRVLATVSAVIRQMDRDTPSLRLGVVRYRANAAGVGVNYAIKPQPLTRDVHMVRKFLVDAAFGGDSGGWNEALRHAISSFTWRANARKVILVIGDTTPRAAKLDAAYRLVSDAWEFDHIQCNTLLIPTAHHPGDHQRSYGALARLGSGRFYQYLRNWGHLCDMTPKQLQPRAKLILEEPEFPVVTLSKWVTPLDEEKKQQKKEAKKEERQNEEKKQKGNEEKKQ